MQYNLCNSGSHYSPHGIGVRGHCIDCIIAQFLRVQVRYLNLTPTLPQVTVQGPNTPQGEQTLGVSQGISENQVVLYMVDDSGLWYLLVFLVNPCVFSVLLSGFWGI